MASLKIIKLFVLVNLLYVNAVSARRDDPEETPEEREGVRYANNCEACKYLAVELQERLV
jgi:hypothetical protein